MRIIFSYNEYLYDETGYITDSAILKLLFLVHTKHKDKNKKTLKSLMASI